jgi:hypothetical protein
MAVLEISVLGYDCISILISVATDIRISGVASLKNVIDMNSFMSSALKETDHFESDVHIA